MGRPVAITLTDLHFAYDATELFAGLDLVVPWRQTLAVVGASGTGKTSLLHLIAGILKPSAGSIKFVARSAEEPAVLPKQTPATPAGPGPRRRPSDTARAPRLGIMFQQNALLPWFTAAKNVSLGLRFRGAARKEARRRAEAALGDVGLVGLTERFPSQLSGGQRQRAALARTLVLEPDILLLDEPFAAVDTLTREALQELVSATAITRADATLLVTHSVEEAAFLADRVVVLARAEPPPGGSARAPAVGAESSRRRAGATREPPVPAAIVADIAFADGAATPRSAAFRRTDDYFERCRRIRAGLEAAGGGGNL